MRYATDLKNFALGTVKEPWRKAAYWGSWSLGFIVPALVVGVLFPQTPIIAPFALAVGVATVAGFAYGMVTGGMHEVHKKREEVADTRRAQTMARSKGVAYEPSIQQYEAQETGRSPTHWQDHVGEQQLALNLQMQGLER